MLSNLLTHSIEKWAYLPVRRHRLDRAVGEGRGRVDAGLGTVDASVVTWHVLEHDGLSHSCLRIHWNMQTVFKSELVLVSRPLVLKSQQNSLFFILFYIFCYQVHQQFPTCGTNKGTYFCRELGSMQTISSNGRNIFFKFAIAFFYNYSCEKENICSESIFYTACKEIK